MSRVLKETIHAKGFEIGIYTEDFQNEYISLTDIARYKSDEPNDAIKNWMRSRDTIEFLGLWEILNNENFKPVEFDGLKNEAGANAFTMSPKKWIESTNAIGIVSKSGRYGGTFAHSDIAFEFASWISPEFKLYIIKDYQRLKQDENSRLSLNWNLNRESYNAILINQGCEQAERMRLLHDLAVQQMRTLSSLDMSGLPKIEEKR